jgi:copper homeostasis protein
MLVEICIDSLESAIAAQDGGAGRVELCEALHVGGLTPHAELIRAVRAALKLQLFTMIRPRAGNFVYDDSEFAQMQRDIELAKSLGCDGVVLGILTAQDEIDIERTRALVELARPIEVTFHRAFDEARNLEEALEAVIGTGANRILTSGGESTALAGAAQLAKLNAKAAGRIQLMAGGGVRPGNVATLLRRTNLQEIHSAVTMISALKPSPWPFVRREDVIDLCRQAAEAFS